MCSVSFDLFQTIMLRASCDLNIHVPATVTSIDRVTDPSVQEITTSLSADEVEGAVAVEMYTDPLIMSRKKKVNSSPCFIVLIWLGELKTETAPFSCQTSATPSLVQV